MLDKTDAQEEEEEVERGRGGGGRPGAQHNTETEVSDSKITIYTMSNKKTADVISLFLP